MKSAEALGGGINKTEAKHLKNEHNNRNSERKRAFSACLPALHEGWRRPIWLDFLPMRQLHTSLIFYFPSHNNASRQPEILTLQHLLRSCLSEGSFLLTQNVLYELFCLCLLECACPNLPAPEDSKRRALLFRVRVCHSLILCLDLLIVRDLGGLVKCLFTYILINSLQFHMVELRAWNDLQALLYANQGAGGTNEYALILPKEGDCVSFNWNKAWIMPSYTRRQCHLGKASGTHRPLCTNLAAQMLMQGLERGSVSKVTAGKAESLNPDPQNPRKMSDGAACLCNPNSGANSDRWPEHNSQLA